MLIQEHDLLTDTAFTMAVHRYDRNVKQNCNTALFLQHDIHVALS